MGMGLFASAFIESKSTIWQSRAGQFVVMRVDEFEALQGRKFSSFDGWDATRGDGLTKALDWVIHISGESCE